MTLHKGICVASVHIGLHFFISILPFNKEIVPFGSVMNTDACISCLMILELLPRRTTHEESLEWVRRYHCLSWPFYAPGAHFTNDFVIVIQIRWKYHSALFQFVFN